MRSNARAMVEGEKSTDAMVVDLPPPGPTIDLGGDEEEEEEVEEEEEEEYSFFRDQHDKGNDDDDDEGPCHFGRSGRVVSSMALPSQGVIGGESLEAPGDKQGVEGEKASAEGE